MTPNAEVYLDFSPKAGLVRHMWGWRPPASRKGESVLGLHRTFHGLHVMIYSEAAQTLNDLTLLYLVCTVCA